MTNSEVIQWLAFVAYVLRNEFNLYWMRLALGRLADRIRVQRDAIEDLQSKEGEG